MRWTRGGVPLLAMLTGLLLAAPARGQEADTERTFILGVGGAGELELADGSPHPGVSAFLE